MSNMVVQTNVLALNAHRNMKGIGTMQSKASQRLSSGFKINSAADDAAGLAISEKMRAQIRGLDMASKNAQDAQSLIQTAEGGMQEIDNMLQRIRELTVSVSNDTNENNTTGTGDRQKIQDEINQLVEEIDSMADRVEFNKKKVIDGTFDDPNAKNSYLDQQLATKTAALDAANTSVANLTTQVTTLADSRDDAFAAFATAGTDLNTALTDLTSSTDYVDYQKGEAMRPVYDQAVKDQSAAMDDFLVEQDKVTEAQSKAYAAGAQNLTADGLADISAALDTISVGTDAMTVITGNTDTDLTGIATALASTVTALNTYDGTLFNGTSGAGFDISGGAAASITFTDQDDIVGAAEQLTAYAAALDTDITNATTAGDAAAVSFLQAAKVQVGAALKAVDYVSAGNIAQTIKTDILDPADTAKDLLWTPAKDGLADKFEAAEKDYKAKSTANDTAISNHAAALGAQTQAVTDQTTAQKDYDAINKIMTDRTAKAQALDAANLEAGLYFQVGANAQQGLQLSIGSVKSDVLGIGDGAGKTTIDVLKDTGANITETLNVLDTALSYVTSERSKLGAASNRLDYTMKSLDISSENLSAAESRIRDTDMAKEMMNLTKANVLQQASVSMLAQANQAPQSILQLLQ